MEIMRGYLKEFKNLDIFVVLPHNDECNIIMGALRQLGAIVKHSWPVPRQLPAEGGALICEFSHDVAAYTPWLPGEAPLPFILHVPGNLPVDFKEIRNCAPHSLLYSPITETSIALTLLLARDQFEYEQRLRSRINRLDENLRAMRAVEQAKNILMEVKKIDEEEAYKNLRHAAMERRVTLGSNAKAIVDSHELLR